MRRIVRAGLSLSWIFLFIAAVQGALFAAPSISSVSPTSGPSGEPITITGRNFGTTKGNSTVTFGGVTASITTWSGTSIVAVVPTGIVSGTVGVVVKVNNASSNSVSFTVLPSITNIAVNSVLMNSAPQNQLLTLNGSGFGTSQGTHSSVTFNGLTAVPSSWNNTAISVPVPAGATTGSIVVNVNGNPTRIPVHGHARTATTGSAFYSRRLLGF
ncbi:MAG: IPT/TIG domain-containing protein [Acidobacteria bacterium]|nr:IPT/TIG domain-containing protein [Acidobacteriota bacterium]